MNPTAELAPTRRRVLPANPTVGVAIPAIPPRSERLATAIRSVAGQTRTPDAVSVVFDMHREGAAATRNRAWRALDTDLVAFVDDDDELLRTHLERLVATLCEQDADMVYPWFTVVGGVDPFPAHFGKSWDPDEPRQTTVTCLWRRDALEAVDGFPAPGDDVDAAGNRIGEDYAAVLRLNDLGGRIVHLEERTWLWNHWMDGGRIGNTSGRGDRW